MHKIAAWVPQNFPFHAFKISWNIFNRVFSNLKFLYKNIIIFSKKTQLLIHSSLLNYDSIKRKLNMKTWQLWEFLC